MLWKSRPITRAAFDFYRAAFHGDRYSQRLLHAHAGGGGFQMLCPAWRSITRVAVRRQCFEITIRITVECRRVKVRSGVYDNDMHHGSACRAKVCSGFVITACTVLRCMPRKRWQRF